MNNLQTYLMCRCQQLRGKDIYNNAFTFVVLFLISMLYELDAITTINLWCLASLA